MHKAFLSVAGAFLFFLCFSGAPNAGELTGIDIARMAEENNTFAVDNASISAKMVITTKFGAERERVIESKMKKTKELTKKYIHFSAPPDIKGTAFLGIEEKGKEIEQYLYLPSIKTDRRIRTNQKNDSFMGTDFTFKDLEGRDVDKANHNRMPDEKVEGADCYVIESTPKDLSSEIYSKYITYVNKSAKVPVKIRYFDLKGEELKILTVKKLEKVEGRWISKESEMVNLQEKSATKLFIDKVTFSEKIDDEFFTRRYLKRG